MSDANEFITKYISLLQGKYQGLNLTRITDELDFRHKQYDDSILPFTNPELLAIFNQCDGVVDLGFGGGFPLLPLAWSYRTKRIMGVEAREKKVAAVRDIALSLGLTNVFVTHARYEEINFDRNVLIITKAMDQVKNVLETLTASVPCLIGFYKGKELESLEDLAVIKNEKVLDFEYTLANGHQRRFLLYRVVPRGTNPKKKLVNLSKLLFT